MTGDTSRDGSNQIGTLAFGLFLIVAGTAILYFSKEIRVLDLGNHDPGARVVPQAMAVIMLFGGVFEIVLPFARGGMIADWSQRRTGSVDHRFRMKRPVFTVGLFFLYVVSLNKIGFVASSFVFLVIFLKMLGSKWWEALLASGVIVFAVYLLFTQTFRVQLPAGEFLPF